MKETFRAHAYRNNFGTWTGRVLYSNDIFTGEEWRRSGYVSKEKAEEAAERARLRAEAGAERRRLERAKAAT